MRVLHAICTVYYQEQLTNVLLVNTSCRKGSHIDILAEKELNGFSSISPLLLMM